MRRMIRGLRRLVKVLLIALVFVTPYAIFRYAPELTLPKQGEVIGKLGDEEIYSNRDGNRGNRSDYGLKFECVEFVNRVYVKRLDHKNMSHMGDADSYFYNPGPKGLVAYPQGGDVAPQPWDILVFDGGPSDGKPGHVAIVSKVDEAKHKVYFVQQNLIAPKFPSLEKWFPWLEYKWQDTAALEHIDGKWYIVPNPNYYPPVAGWSRRKVP